MIEEKIRDLLIGKFREETFSDCFLVEIKLSGGNKLEVFVDCDSGLTHEKCRQISRFLESYLDEEQWLGEKYVLEVSSPGVGKALKIKRQYRKSIGRKVEVTFREGKPLTGKLIETKDDSIIIEYETVIKEGKKKRKETIRRNIPFENIEKTVVKVVF